MSSRFRMGNLLEYKHTTLITRLNTEVLLDGNKEEEDAEIIMEYFSNQVDLWKLFLRKEQFESKKHGIHLHS